MITITVTRVVYTSLNRLGKQRVPVYITYHGGIDRKYPINLYKKGIRLKDITKESMGLSWNSGGGILDRESFSK